MANINVDLVRERRSFSPGFRPGMNGSRPLYEGEPFVNFADLVRCIGSGDGGFVETPLVAPFLSALNFGLKGNNSFDNTARLQKAIDATSSLGGELYIPVSPSGPDYRLGVVNWRDVNLRFDEGVKLLNLDGSRYNGGYAGAGAGLLGLVNPGFDKRGRRIDAPAGRVIDFLRPGDRDANFLTWSGLSGNPYEIYCAQRDFALLGQSEPTSGSLANLGLFANIYDVSNGPGYTFTATATNGSPVLTNVSPSPLATHPFTRKDGIVSQIANVTLPGAVTGPGVPAGSSVRAFDASTITLGAAGSYEATAPYTGPTGQITITVVSGRCEFNSISWHMEAVGKTGEGGPAGGMNWYNDIFVVTNRSNNPAHQEAACFGLEVFAVKQVPGLLRDDLHNGSGGLAVQMIPVAGNDTYTLHDGIVVTGWAGPIGSTGAQSGGTSPAAEHGLRVGGGCSSVYTKSTWRSWFKVGVRIQDYETAIIIDEPREQNSGTAVYIAEGAGRIDAPDVTVRRNMIEPNPGTPASATAPGTTGQHAWDANYEYRCVAPNTWKRTPLSSW